MFKFFEDKKALYSSMSRESKLFYKFCKLVYSTEELQITPTEKHQFEILRKQEAEDYNYRKKIFWPLYVSGLLLFDNQVVMPATRTNWGRGLYHLFLGLPFVGIVASGVVFYREKFPSHEYAFELCEKYNITLTSEEEQAENYELLIKD